MTTDIVGNNNSVAPNAKMVMPNALEAEREILSAILIDQEMFFVASEHLNDEHFYQPRHQYIFRAMKVLNENAAPIDPVSLAQQLKDTGDWEKIGGAAAIGELLDRGGSLGSVEHYCKIVRQKANIRRMVQAAQFIETEGLQDIDDVDGFLDQAEQRIFQVLEEQDTSRMRAIGSKRDRQPNF